MIWLLQAVSGGLLLVVLGLHLLANHTTGGLLHYESALARFQDPAMFTVETVFLFFVIFHAFNGLRGVIMDYLRDDRWNRLVGGIMTAMGAVAAGYGLWLSLALRAR